LALELPIVQVHTSAFNFQPAIDQVVLEFFKTPPPRTRLSK